jgi:hypothetical protein
VSARPLAEAGPGLARLLALFRIERGEVERVALMLLLSLVSVGGIVITGQIVGRSLFLSALPASAIPLRFIVPPIVLVLTTAAYSRRLGGREQSRVVVATLSVAGAGGPGHAGPGRHVAAIGPRVPCSRCSRCSTSPAAWR